MMHVQLVYRTQEVTSGWLTDLNSSGWPCNATSVLSCTLDRRDIFSSHAHSLVSMGGCSSRSRRPFRCSEQGRKL